MCASLTVSARTLFFPKVVPGNEAAIIKYLQGFNELHHTLTNQIMAYLDNEELRPRPAPYRVIRASRHFRPPDDAAA